MGGGAQRFEARPHPVSPVQGILSAWDHQHDDLAREPGPGREPRVFVSEDQVLGWAARQESDRSAVEQAPGGHVEGSGDRGERVDGDRGGAELALSDRAPVELDHLAELLLTEPSVRSECSDAGADLPTLVKLVFIRQSGRRHPSTLTRS
jgi:hypothetical protein